MEMVSVYVGLDYHSDTIRVCVMTTDGEELLNRNVLSNVGNVSEAVRTCLERKHRRPEDAPVVIVEGVAIEACTGSAEFATRLIAATEWLAPMAVAVGDDEVGGRSLTATSHG